MTLNKRHSKRYITDLNNITAYAWDQLSQTNDYKWICQKGKEPDELAVGAYQYLLFQFNELNLSRLKERRDITLMVMDLVISISEGPMTVERLKILKPLMQGMILAPTEIPLGSLSKLLKDSDQRVQLSFIKLAVKKYKDSETPEGKHKNIFERAAACSKELNGTPIDVKKVSIVQFLAYEKAAFNPTK